MRYRNGWYHIIGVLLIAAILGVIIWAESPDPPKNAPPVTQIDFIVFSAQAACYAALLFGVSAFFTRRIVFSLTVVLAISVSLVVLSKVKYVYLKQKLLFTDFYYQFREIAELQFFFQNYFIIVILSIIYLILCLFLLAVVYYYDEVRISRKVAFIFTLLSAALVQYAWGHVHPIYRDTVFAHASASNRHLPNFTISARMFVDHLSRPLVLGDGVEPSQKIAELPTVNTPAPLAKKPNVIVILHESSVDPSIYYDDPKYNVQKYFFRSGDGQFRRLNVKAYGGKTWISEHGFALGADLSYFSSRKDFLGVVASGKFKNSIAHEFGSHGYRTAVNYPAPTTFLNTKNFYKSLGFDAVNSEKDMNLEIKFGGPRPRDYDYYNFLIQDLKKTRQETGDARPAFYFVLTSATHYPWNYREFPGVRDDEFVPGDPVAEYARRQRIAADDLLRFKDALAENFPSESFLIAGFGDHHPVWTHDYVHGHVTWKGRPRDPAETMWRTYYYVDGVNFLPEYKTLSHEIEIGLLGESVLSAAGLPMSSSYQVRNLLRRLCNGKWADCAEQDILKAVNAMLSKGPHAIFVE